MDGQDEWAAATCPKYNRSKCTNNLHENLGRDTFAQLQVVTFHRHSFHVLISLLLEVFLLLVVRIKLRSGKERERRNMLMRMMIGRRVKEMIYRFRDQSD